MTSKQTLALGGLGLALLIGCNAVLGFGDYAVGADAGREEEGGAEDGGDAASDDPCLAPNKPTIELTEVTTDTTLECKNDYLLRNQVFVRPGATLTIPPGTTVKGTRGDLS